MEPGANEVAMTSWLAETIRRNAAAHPGRPAFVAAGRSTSYGEFAALCDAAAAALRGAGVGPGDRLLVQAAGHADLLALVLACMAAGAIAVPASPQAGPGWLQTLQAASGSIAVARSATELQPLQPSPVQAPPLAADVHALVMTSGSTGAPKSVPVHAAMADAAAQAAIEALQLSAGSVFQNFIPPWTVGGIFLAGLPPLAAGATQVLDPFNPYGFLPAVGALRPTHAILLPVMIRVLRQLDAWAGADLSCFQTILSGAAPVAESLAEAVLARGARRFVHAYGSSECLTPVVIRASVSADAPAKTALSDFCAGYAHRLGEDGELLLQGPAVMRGYAGAAAGKGFEDGWFRTGDLFAQGEHGLHFVGRNDARLKVNGFSVSPEVTEAAILELPGVAGCAAVQAGGRAGGESLQVLVAGPAVDLAAILAHCRARLDAPQVPRRVVVVEKIPLNAMGKMDRQAAAALAGQA